MRIAKMVKFPDDTYRLLVQGVARAEVTEFTAEEPFLRGRVRVLEETGDLASVESLALMRNVAQQFASLVSESPRLSDELQVLVANTDHPSKLADLAGSSLDFDVAGKQELIEELDVPRRLRRVLDQIVREHDAVKVESEIREKVQSDIGKSQRDYVLRQQLEAIRQELGEAEDGESEVQRLEQRIAAAGMPEEAEKQARRELDRLAQMPTAAAEHSVIRTYLEWMVELPWSKTVAGPARRRGGAPDPRPRSLRPREGQGSHRRVHRGALAQARSQGSDPVLRGAAGNRQDLAGPLDRARARSRVPAHLARRRARRGGDPRPPPHLRRRAAGPRSSRGCAARAPGIRCSCSTRSTRSARDFRGDPSSALLEVLDPAQNSTFSDHYLEVPFDLSQVLFVATANVIDPVPAALRDRMEVIELPGYTQEEKLEIAKRFLVPRQREQNGVDQIEFEIPDETLRTLIRSYTHEAGVRNLEREIAALARKVARRVAEEDVSGPQRIAPEDLPTLLGPVKYEPEIAERVGQPGVAAGLAWTPSGGDILFIESTRMPGKGALKLTGSLGDVMRESAEAARSWLHAHAGDFGLDPELFAKSDLHLHVPSGGVPKDGPSAGVAMVTSLTSLLTGRPADPRVAMTGEITLRGKVLPVGGIKEKVLAAKRAGHRAGGAAGAQPPRRRGSAEGAARGPEPPVCGDDR